MSNKVKENYSDPSYNYSFDTTYSIKFGKPDGAGANYSEPNRIDFGLAFGGGVLYKIGSGCLMAEIRYDLGLTHTTKYVGTKPTGTDLDESKNGVFTIAVGYLFKIGK